jgi:PAS domain S-box-containing protein
MKKRSKSKSSSDKLREKIIGLGEHSHSKSYYPQLQQRIADLEESEAKFRGIFESIIDIYYQTDMEGKITLISPSIYNVSGYKPEELIGTSMSDHYEDPELRRKLIDELKAEGKVKNFESTIIKKDGGKIILSTNAQFKFDNKGVPICVEGIARDVTEHKNAEKTLRKKEARIRSIFRSAPIGIGLVSNRILLQVNDYLCDMLGYKSEELINKNAIILYPSKQEYDFVGEEKYNQIKQRGTGTVETIFKRKDGTLRNILLSSTPINLIDYSEGVTFTALDITDRKRSEEALKKSQSLYYDLVETSQDLIWQCDAEGRYTYLNPAWEEVFGYKVEEMLGRKFSDFQTPEFAERDLKQFESLLIGKTIKGLETVHLGKKGNEIHLVFNAKFILDEFGNIAGYKGNCV